MLTQERLKQVLYYNPHVGVFVWKNDGRRVRRGQTAGGAHKGRGYIKVTVDGKSYSAHLLVWLYVHGKFPVGQIDHIDGDRSNNLLLNLREVEPAQNSWNAKTPKSNTSGYKGVFQDGATGKYRGQVRHSGKRYWTKPLDSMAEAAAELMVMREALHCDFANHGVHRYEIEEMLDGTDLMSLK